MLTWDNNNFKVDLEKVLIVSNATTRWTFIKSSKEVQIDNATSSEEEDIVEPSKIFTMHEKGFKYKYVGTEKINEREIPTAYPNPSNGNFSLRLKSIQTSSIKLYSILGNLVYENNSPVAGENNIQTKNLTPGIYLIKIMSGEKYIVQRVVVE